jgi:hypothetical protein
MASTAPAVISVVDLQGRTHRVIGWAAEIIAEVLLEADHINAIEVGHVHAKFGPTSGLWLEVARNTRRKR